MEDGQKVGIKNGSIFRDYLKTSKECRSEYNDGISKYDQTNKLVSEMDNLPRREFHKTYGAGLDTTITHLGKPPILGYTKHNR